MGKIKLSEILDSDKKLFRSQKHKANDQLLQKCRIAL